MTVHNVFSFLYQNGHFGCNAKHIMMITKPSINIVTVFNLFGTSVSLTSINVSCSLFLGHVGSVAIYWLSNLNTVLYKKYSLVKVLRLKTYTTPCG